jgi:hypothetical protein
MAVAHALAEFAQVSSGHFSHGDKCIFPENVVLGSRHLLHEAERRVVCGCEKTPVLARLYREEEGSPSFRLRVTQRCVGD